MSDTSTPEYKKGKIVLAAPPVAHCTFENCCLTEILEGNRAWAPQISEAKYSENERDGVAVARLAGVGRVPYRNAVHGYITCKKMQPPRTLP